MPNEKNALQEQRIVSELRDEIRRLTGRAPVSRSVSYLAARLADIKAAKKSGEDVKRRTSEPQSPMNVSTSVSQHAAVKRMAESEGMTVSELVRLAVHDYARKRGHAEVADLFSVTRGA